MRRRPFVLTLGSLALGSALRAETQPADATDSASVDAEAARALVFPRDFGAHPTWRTEWWYATGWLADAASDSAATRPRFGFQVTFFRSRTEVDTGQPSRFAARQLIFAHTALTDLSDPGKPRLRHDQRIARSGFGIAGAADDDTAVTLRDWSLQRSGSATASLYHAAIASDNAGYRYVLQMQTTQPVLLQGDAGFSRKGPQRAQFSRYYSQPQLDVSGELTLDGRSRAVRGRAWLDHEWSDTLLDRDAVGWDWIGMNLTDGSALTAFRLRRADGSALWAGGSFRDAAGERRNFAPDEVSFAPGRRWISAGSRANYPVEWTVQTPAGRYTVKALLDDQELDSRGSTGSIYWEGLSELFDAAGRSVGRGYLEMTGYAGSLRL